jgi:hypothetical protein
LFGVAEVVRAGLLDGGAGGGGDLLPGGAGLPGGLGVILLPAQQQGGQRVVCGQGVQRADDGRCRVQVAGEDFGAVGVAGLVGGGDLAGEDVSVAQAQVLLIDATPSLRAVGDVPAIGFCCWCPVSVCGARGAWS